MISWGEQEAFCDGVNGVYSEQRNMMCRGQRWNIIAPGRQYRSISVEYRGLDRNRTLTTACSSPPLSSHLLHARLAHKRKNKKTSQAKVSPLLPCLRGGNRKQSQHAAWVSCAWRGCANTTNCLESTARPGSNTLSMDIANCF